LIVAECEAAWNATELDRIFIWLNLIQHLLELNLTRIAAELVIVLIVAELDTTLMSSNSVLTRA